MRPEKLGILNGPCALRRSALELCLLYIGASCYGPETWSQIDDHDMAGGNTCSSFQCYQ